MSTIAAVLGRILLALIFVVSGATKLLTLAATEAVMVGAGLPPGLAVPTALFEIAAGVLLALGLMTRLVSTLLFAFVALATLFFHKRFTDPVQAAMAMKNLAIMGGLLLVFAHSHLWYGWDRLRRDRRAEIAGQRAEERIHDAELRAARAEGRAAATQTGGTVVTDVDRDGVPEVRRRRWLGW